MNMSQMNRLNGPRQWWSYQKKDDSSQIRLCTDMRQANRANEGIHYPSPTIDDLIQDVSGSNIFCKLDLNKAFLQLELHEDSRYITTFIKELTEINV